jgi:hypothetical protein
MRASNAEWGGVFDEPALATAPVFRDNLRVQESCHRLAIFAFGFFAAG